MSKQNRLTHFFAKNKPTNSTEDGLSNTTSSQNEVPSSKAKGEKPKFLDVWKSEFSRLLYDPGNDIMYCNVCRQAGPDIAGKTEFATGKKKFKCESLVCHNKSQKHEKCFNMVSVKATSSTNTSSSSKPSSSSIRHSFEKVFEKQ